MPPFLYAVISVLIMTVLFLAWRLVRSPVWKQIQLRKAAKLAATGHTEEMEKYLRRNMARSRVSDPLTNALVYFFIRSGRFDEAGEIVKEAVKRGDDSGMALAQMGYVHGGKGEHDLAEDYYRKACERDDSLRSTMYSNIAGMLVESGTRLDEAEKLLKEALELREGTSRSGIHINLALLYLARKKPVDARVQAMTAYELIPAANQLLTAGRANALAIASRACLMQGDRQEAVSFARKALKLIQDTPGTQRLAEELRAILPEGDTGPGE